MTPIEVNSEDEARDKEVLRKVYQAQLDEYSAKITEYLRRERELAAEIQPLQEEYAKVEADAFRFEGRREALLELAEKEGITLDQR